MADEKVDQVVRDEVAQVRHDLANHKMITEIKLDNVLKVVAELKSQLKWAGGLIVMLFISTLTWSLTQQYNANEAQKKDMQQQLDMLREQERARNASRAEIMSRLPPGGPETALTADRLTQESDLRDMRPNNGGKN